MILLNEPFDAYKTSGCFGIHALLDFEKRGPFYFHQKHIEHACAETRRRAFDIGKAAHTLILEGEEAYDGSVVQKPAEYTNDKGETKPWNGNAKVCKDWERQHEDCAIISESDHLMLHAMLLAVRRNQDIMRYLRSGMPEVVFREGMFQIRVDWLAGAPDPMSWEAICDLKTCDSLSEFHVDIYRYNYHRQAAFYQWMIQQETGIVLPFKMLAVEKAPPHRCGVYYVSDDGMELGHRRNEYLVEQVERHVRMNVWPTGNPEGEQECDVPYWLGR